MPTAGMNKVRCTQCGVINLEKFVTFPYCAACGALLPQLPARSTSWWQRPMKPFLWVTAIGCTAAGLVAATTTFNSTPPEPGHIVIYGRVPYHVRVGQSLTLQLTPDTIESPTSRDQRLTSVRLRLAGSWLQKFKLLDLKPRPDAVTLGGNGRYFHFRALARNVPLQLTVRALQPGQYHLKAAIYAEQQYPGEYQATINVTAR